MRKNIVFTTLLFFAGFFSTGSLRAQSVTANKPNVIVIIADDQQYRTIRALNNPEIVTPNMDRLVKEGTSFTQAHIQGGLSGAICCPSRAMLMTGRDLFSLRRDGAFVPPSDTTFPQHFRDNGYTTFATGKWHQDKACFNRSFVNGDNIFFGGMLRPDLGGQYRPTLNKYDSTGRYNAPFWGDHYSSVYFADAAVEFLKEQRSSGQPFLLYLSFTSPHDPRTPPTWYGHSYTPQQVSLPPNFLPEHPFDNGELVIRDETLLPFPRTEQAVREEIAKYYSMISEVDHQIGRVMETLKQTGKDKNTIIVFAGDNGLAVGEHGLLGKQNPYDCSIRVPLIFYGPGIPAGKQVDKYVYLHDIYPTLCDLARLPVPATVQSRSLYPAFKGSSFTGRDEVFFAYLNIQRAIVKDHFKLVRYNVNGTARTQLFDLRSDPYEMKDLSGEKAYQAKVRSLTGELTQMMKKAGDFCDPGQPGWGHPVKWTPAQVKALNP